MLCPDQEITRLLVIFFLIFGFAFFSFATGILTVRTVESLSLAYARIMGQDHLIVKQAFDAVDEDRPKVTRGPVGCPPLLVST